MCMLKISPSPFIYVLRELLTDFIKDDDDSTGQRELLMYYTQLVELCSGNHLHRSAAYCAFYSF